MFSRLLSDFNCIGLLCALESLLRANEMGLTSSKGPIAFKEDVSTLVEERTYTLLDIVFRAVFQRDDETIDIADSSSSSSSDDEPEVIESCKEDKTESVKPTPKKAQQNLDGMYAFFCVDVLDFWSPAFYCMSLSCFVDWLRFRTPTPLKFGRMRTFRTPSTDSMDSNARNAPGSQAYENHFLASLSEHLPPSADFTRSEESVQFLKSFHKRKDALVHRLLKTYNEHVFKNRVSQFAPCVRRP